MANPHPMDRNKYNPERVKKILFAIEMGSTIVHACGYAGISSRTFYEWQKHYPEFAEQVEMAEGAATVKWLARIEQASNMGTWQAAAWKLERRHPHIYGRRVVEHDGAIDYVIDLSGSTNNHSQAFPIDDSSTKVLE